MAKRQEPLMECVTCAPWKSKGELEGRQSMDIVSGRCGETGLQTPARFGCRLWHDDEGHSMRGQQGKEHYPGYNG